MAAIETVTCPICGYEQKIKLHSVIDADEHLDLKIKLMDGAFFEHTCEHCGKTYDAHHQVVYGDKKNGVLIYYARDELEIAHAYDAIHQLSGSFDNKKMTRVVTSYQELIEKVRISDMHLDDRIIEIMKVAILNSIAESQELDQIDEMTCWIADDGNMTFGIFGNNTGTVLVQKEFYYYIALKCQLLLDKQLPNPIDVGLDFAIDFIERNNFKFK